jgi:hypothetical protein
MTSLYYNNNPIWAKRYDDAGIYHVTDVESSGILTIDNVASISNHNLERKSSLDPYPSNFYYSNNKATVHWGDVFRAKGGVSGTTVTLPSGNNIRIDSEREIYLSGEVSLAKDDAPKLVYYSTSSDQNLLKFTNFYQFGETYYTTYWNGYRDRATDFCRCWIQLFKANFKSSGGVYSITSLETPSTLPTSYDKTIGGWVLSPSDYVNNSYGIGVNNSTYDGIFKQRQIITPGGTSGYTAVWMVRTCYRNGWGAYAYAETFGSTYSKLTESIIISAFNNSGLSSIAQGVTDAVNWMSSEPYAKT